MIGAHTLFMLRQRLGGKWAFIHVNKCGGSSVERLCGLPRLHDTALERRRAVGAARWDAMFKFALVRNPYERALSLYRYRVKRGRGGMGDGHISFDDWVQAAIVEHNPRYYDKPLMFAPAHAWLADETGKLMVDEIIRLEEIDQAWPRIAGKIGAPPVMAHENRTEKTGGPVMSPASKAAIAKAYAIDFEAFGYPT